MQGFGAIADKRDLRGLGGVLRGVVDLDKLAAIAWDRVGAQGFFYRGIKSSGGDPRGVVIIDF